MVVEISRRQFFALFARGAHGAKNPKKCRGPCGWPAGVRPCASKERRGGFRVGGAQTCGMESGMVAGALRAWGAARRRQRGRLRGLASAPSRRERGRVPESGASVRNGAAFPAPLAADMRTGPLAARWFSARKGYGAARHVRCKKEASR